MKRKFRTVIVILAVILVVTLLYSISVRNRLIGLDEKVHSEWSQISTQLQRRADLIPNLVQTVREYEKHETAVFTELADARNALLGAQSPEASAQADGAAAVALGRLLALSENYPELRSNDNFIRLQDELAGTENRVAVARGRYNESVNDFNASIRKFPGSLFAPGLGFQPAEYFQPAAGSSNIEESPKVDF